ncbi:MAG TPA: ATP-binding protein [Kofleriaceae bacterium]|nr:ATP-binding protein [Kofleriaceae bacterium]
MTTVARVITTHRDEIITHWLEGVRRLAFAEDLNDAELAGVIPELLDSLGAATSSAVIDEIQASLVERHLSGRLRQGATLDEILGELAILSQSVCEAIDHHMRDERPVPRDVARVLAEINHACITATRIFNTHLLEDEQPLERYLRHMQAISHHHDPQPVKAALSLIMKAMGADTAAILLVDPTTRSLLMSASAGLANEALERTVSQLALTDADLERLEVSAALRDAGIHSLLGIRLSSRHTLRGVLYVGVHERRSFSASELRLLESLGEALALHLDHARVRAVLGAREAELRAERELHQRFVSTLVAAVSAPLGRTREMLAELVDAHRIHSGQPLELRIEQCDLSRMVQQTVDDMCLLDGDRFVADTDLQVLGMWSPDHLRRAVRILAGNAVRYGSTTEPVLIAVRRADDGARISVHNKGEAIEPESQASLFRPFLARTSGQGYPPGWGLGLTLVWGSVGAHGGRIEVASAPGEGTTFTMVLPYDARPYAD